MRINSKAIAEWKTPRGVLRLSVYPRSDGAMMTMWHLDGYRRTRRNVQALLLEVGIAQERCLTVAM